MAAREYKLRMPREIPEATSETVAAWLDQAATDKTRLAADPGGGPVRISLSLDPEKVVEFANARKERVHIALRRLIASHVKIEPLPDAEATSGDARTAAEAKELLPEKVLPRKLAYSDKDFIGLVRGGDKLLARIYRRAYGLSELKPAETPEEDRELAAAMAEVCNRRSPAWMLANADLVKLGIVSFRWGIAQTEDLDARVREGKASKNGNAAAVIDLTPEAPQAPAETRAPDNSPAPTPPSETAGIPAVELQHLDTPVQQEGEF